MLCIPSFSILVSSVQPSFKKQKQPTKQSKTKYLTRKLNPNFLKNTTQLKCMLHYNNKFQGIMNVDSKTMN